MSLYGILLLSSISVPLLLSFDKKLQFFRSWKFVFPAILIVAAIYIFFDVLLTKNFVWGFNPQYHSTNVIFGLPIEEWLFFVVIPYASLFLHYSFVLYFPQIKLSNRTTQIITKALIIGMAVSMAMSFDKTYTLYITATMLVTLLVGVAEKSELLNRFYITFLLILIPFIIVNGILTGSFIEGEVVWYNSAENLGKRFFTIPIEDFLYAFSMIFLSLILTETFKTKGKIFRKEMISNE
ncbi:MAG: lycopene cyclase domain-containing protein [Bacteroidales bacterium]|nr:lycopene cyclase domain-containing protein [Bacteroidales bacterium]